jgi:hypothetical protein
VYVWYIKCIVVTNRVFRDPVINRVLQSGYLLHFLIRLYWEVGWSGGLSEEEVQLVESPVDRVV